MKRLVILCTVILVVLLSVVSVAGCQQKPEPTPPLAIESLTYTSSEHGFSVEYPKDWDAEEDLMVTGMVVAFMGPSVLGGSFTVNISIVKEQLPEFPKTKLEDYCRMVELNSKRYLANYRKIEETSTTVSGLPAIMRTYNYTTKFDEEELVSKNCQVYFIKDDVAYTITYDTLVEFHNEYADCYDLVIRSFTFD